MRVPKPPEGLSAAEEVAWGDIARSAIRLGTLAASDLQILVVTAKVAARVDEILARPAALPSHVAALVNLYEKLLAGFGLSPRARRGVAPLPERAPDAASDPLAEFDS
jgi:phage terminase small subunit